MKVRILYLEDDLLDQRAFLRLVRQNQLPYQVCLQQTVQGALQKLQEDHFDVVITDYFLADGTAEQLYQKVPHIPLVVITGAGDEERAVKALKSGAADYIVKDPELNYIKMLPHTIGNAIRNTRARFTSRMLTHAAENIQEALFICDLQGKLIYVNRAFLNLYGYREEEALGMPMEKLISREGNGKLGLANWEISYHRTADQRVIPVSVSRSLLQDASQVPQAQVFVVRDVSDQMRAAVALQESEDRYRAMVEHAPYAIAVLTGYRVSYVNSSALALLGAKSPEQVEGMSLFQFIDRDVRRNLLVEGHSSPQEERILPAQPVQLRRLDGSPVEVELSGFSLRVEGKSALQLLIRDLTEKRKTEEALRKREEQLRQAQKLEAVGRLAGGIAHDFNNLLMVIKGYTDLLEDDLAPSHPLREYVLEIQNAGQKAHDLTRQLLAFSRRQVMEYTPVDLNQVIAGMESILQRLISPDQSLEIHRRAHSANVLAETAQLEQILMNLVVNARDALGKNGKIVVESFNETFRHVHTGYPGKLEPGFYVVCSVTDNGHGITEEQLQHIFEPFYTTKSPGQGTGLGLATVYGIVKQLGGDILVYAEPNKGTCIRVYLPVCLSAAEPVAREVQTSETNLSGTETILLVEDEASVRALIRLILQRYGYQVLEASHGGEALLLCENQQQRIDLLLADIVLPWMKGDELAEKLLTLRPDMSIILMSGYTKQMVSLNFPYIFLPKPFSPLRLLTQVRNCLDGRA